MSNWVVITGASAGIGAATAVAYAAAGYNVVSLSRRPCPVPGSHHVAVDFFAADWERIAETGLVALWQTQKPTRLVLVHNAAYFHTDHAMEQTGETLRRVLEVNVVVPALLNRIARPYLQSGSAIVFIGSTLSEKAVPGLGSYVTSKHALIGLMRATCQDLAGTGVHTVCVCPGPVDTELMQARAAKDPSIIDKLAARSVLGRMVRTDEIADLVLQVATAPVLNGAVIHANLGQVES